MDYDQAEYWSEVARKVDARGGDGDWDLAGNDGPFHRYKRDMTLARLETLGVAGATVMELGPGPGGNLRALHAQSPKRLIGCEIAPEMVRLAKRNLGSDAEIYQIEGPHLPLADGEADIALTVTVLQHNPKSTVLALLDELTRVTSSTLELIEDTTTFRPRSFGGTYFVRDVTQYIAWVTSRGFALVDVQPMNAWASERAWLGLRRLARAVTCRTYSEGQPVTKAEIALERAVLRATRPVDARLPPLSGKTAMRFQRLDVAGSA